MAIMLYVGNLSRLVTENELRDLFAQAGEVTTTRIIKDLASGASQQYGFVTMSTQLEADRAIDRFNRYALGEQPLRVGLVRPRRRTGTPGPSLKP
jgi:RNA recognition motif-containing protein